MAVGQVLELSLANQHLRGRIELVGQPTLSELDLAVHAAVGGIEVDLDHANILQVDRPPALEVFEMLCTK
jgi:hypothetical protein